MTRGRSRDRKGDRGAALLLVLWGATVMSIIAAASVRESSFVATSASAGAELTKARALADAGVRLGWNAWNDGDMEPGVGRLNCSVGDGALYIVVRSEMSKADLNMSSEELLSSLFAAAGADNAQARNLAGAAVDYRDPDGDRSNTGAEAPDYAAAGLGWRPRDGSFETIEELGYLPGMSQWLYRQVRDDVTVSSRTSEIDLEGASPLMIAALEGYSDEMSGAGIEIVPQAQRGIQGSRVSRDSRVLPQSAGSQARTVSVRVVSLTANGAVFVREAVVAASPQASEPPRFLRMTQGRLEEGEVLPEARSVAPCAPGAVG
jgi:general secretion pathway protein K